MFSDVLKAALDREVVGQAQAIHSVVRGVTRVASGLTPREHAHCTYLFVGPAGTGKSHLIRTLARVLHGDERRIVVADCTQVPPGDPWAALAAQLAPLYGAPGAAAPWGIVDPPRLAILHVEYLERAPREMVKALSVALETGHLLLPGGRRGSLRDCLIFITSTVCSAELLDEAPRIGFTSPGDEEEDRVYKECRVKAEELFGTDLVARLDGLVVFHRLQDEDLSQILDRRLQRLNRYLLARGFQVELSDEARAFLVERGRRDLRMGALELIRTHQGLVEFPLADMLISGRIPSGATVHIERRPKEDHLHFTVTEAPPHAAVPLPAALSREVPVLWDEPPAGLVH